MKKMISLISAALLATVFAASCSKLDKCEAAKDKDTCNEAKSFVEGVYCEWNETVTPAVCVDSPSKKAAAELAAAKAKAKEACLAVTDMSKCSAAVADAAHGKCEKKNNDDTKCTYSESAAE